MTLPSKSDGDKFNASEYNELRLRGASSKSYHAIVYLEGGSVIADKHDGTRISSGTAGTDDTTVIQAAVDSVTSAGGAIIIDQGTYTVTRVTLNKNRLRVLAYGATFSATDTGLTTATYGTPAWTIAPCVLITGSNDVTVQGLKVLGTGANLGYLRDAFLIVDSHHVLLEDCVADTVTGSGYRVTSTGTYDTADPTQSNLSTTHVTIRHCRANATQYYVGPPELKGFGVEVEYAQHVVVENCRVDAAEESPYRTHYASSVHFRNNEAREWTKGECFDIYRSDHVTVTGNKAVNATLKNACAIYEFCQHIVITGNDFNDMAGVESDDTVTVRAVAGSGGDPIRYITFRDNLIANSVLISNDDLEHVDIVGNTIGGRIKVQPFVAVETLKDIRIRGNTCTLGTEQNVTLSTAEGVIITGNRFRNRVYTKLSKDVNVYGNHFTSDGSSFATALYLDGGNGYVRFAGNFVRATTFQAVYAQVASGLGQNTFLDVEGNHLHNIYTSATPGDSVGVRALASNPDAVASVGFIRVAHNVFSQSNGTNSINTSDSTALIVMNHVDKAIAGSATTIIRRTGAEIIETDSRLDIILGSSGAALRTGVTADAVGRFVLSASGEIEWGDGTNARDIRLTRGVANRLDLASGDVLRFTGTTTAERDAITQADGMVTYNTTTNKLQVRAAGAWADLH